MSAPLQLLDVHPGSPPGWWPPAPGWWMLFALLLLVILATAWWRSRVLRRRVAIQRLFDDAVDQAETPSQQIAAMSELLRRAARRQDPAADRLEGDDWLQFLDKGMPMPVFAAGAGSLLRDGAFRGDVGAGEAEALRVLARQRYLQWMLGK